MLLYVPLKMTNNKKSWNVHEWTPTKISSNLGIQTINMIWWLNDETMQDIWRMQKKHFLWLLVLHQRKTRRDKCMLDGKCVPVKEELFTFNSPFWLHSFFFVRNNLSIGKLLLFAEEKNALGEVGRRVDWLRRRNWNEDKLYDAWYAHIICIITWVSATTTSIPTPPSSATITCRLYTLYETSGSIV